MGPLPVKTKKLVRAQLKEAPRSGAQPLSPSLSVSYRISRVRAAQRTGTALSGCRLEGPFRWAPASTYSDYIGISRVAIDVSFFSRFQFIARSSGFEGDKLPMLLVSDGFQAALIPKKPIQVKIFNSSPYYCLP